MAVRQAVTLSPHTLKVLWVNSHAEHAIERQAALPESAYEGNDRAYELARTAADQAGHAVTQWRHDETEKMITECQEVLRRFVAIAKLLQEEEQEQLPKDRLFLRRPSSKAQAKQLLEKPWLARHSTLDKHARGGLFCKRCFGRSPPSWAGKLKWLREGCGRSPRPHASHHLFARGSTAWCTVCGAFSFSRHRGLMSPCPGQASASGKCSLSELEVGRCPRSSSSKGQTFA